MGRLCNRKNRQAFLSGLPAWNPQDPALKTSQEAIGAAKQLLTVTFKNFLSQKAGNDLGFSDFDGFVVVPKITKNEVKGMRFGDEFEMIFAQYVGYFECAPSRSTTEASTEFMTAALKAFQERSPADYNALLRDYSQAVDVKLQKEKKFPNFLNIFNNRKRLNIDGIFWIMLCLMGDTSNVFLHKLAPMYKKYSIRKTVEV